MSFRASDSLFKVSNCSSASSSENDGSDVVLEVTDEVGIDKTDVLDPMVTGPLAGCLEDGMEFVENKEGLFDPRLVVDPLNSVEVAGSFDPGLVVGVEVSFGPSVEDE